MTTGRRGPWPWQLTAAVLLAYLGGLALWRDAVPAGLNNDAAEETLRGVLLIDARRFEVITAIIGIPQETLYLYLAGAVAKLIGTTTLAVHATCWCVALACVWLVRRLVRQIDARLPAWLPLLLAVSSIWLFHYGRAGVRAISAPFFLLAFCALLGRAERNPVRWRVAFAAGAVLGASLYAYTACRVLVVALVLHAGLRLLRCRDPRMPLLRCYAWIAAGALLVSLPNLLFFLAHPREFLLRGSYVVLGGWSAAPGHILWSALLPFHYPDAYRSLTGSAHIFDGVSAGLTAAGINPVHPIVAAAALVGLVPLWRRRALPEVSFLCWTWLCATVLLGLSGPSLTRLLIILPIALVAAALGLWTLLENRAWLATAALLSVLGSSAHSYFATFASDAEAQRYFSPAATPIGQRARALAASGARVLCVVAKDANVVRYLTYDASAAVRVVEVYRRALDPREVPVREFAPDILLVERAPAFARYAAVFPAERRVETAVYEEIRLGPRAE